MNTLFQPFSSKERERRQKPLVMSLGPRTKLLALVQNAKSRALPVFPSALFSLYATSLCLPSSHPQNFPGPLHFCCFFPFPSGVCFYCMPRCLSFQKTSGHDGQQEQRAVAQREAGWQGGMQLKCQGNGFLLLLLSLVSFANFIALQ